MDYKNKVNIKACKTENQVLARFTVECFYSKMDVVRKDTDGTMFLRFTDTSKGGDLYKVSAPDANGWREYKVVPTERCVLDF